MYRRERTRPSIRPTKYTTKIVDVECSPVPRKTNDVQGYDRVSLGPRLGNALAEGSVDVSPCKYGSGGMAVTLTPARRPMHDSRSTYACGRELHSLGPFGRSGPESRATGLGALAERMDSGDRRWQKRQSIAVQETKKPAQLRRASVGRGGTPTSATCYPVYIGRAVKPGVSALPLR